MRAIRRASGLTYGLIIFGAQERRRERETEGDSRGIGTIIFRVAIFRAISRCGRTHISSSALALARNALCHNFQMAVAHGTRLSKYARVIRARARTCTRAVIKFARRGRLFDFATLILRNRCRAALTLKAEVAVSRSGTLRAT